MDSDCSLSSDTSWACEGTDWQTVKKQNANRRDGKKVTVKKKKKTKDVIAIKHGEKERRGQTGTIQHKDAWDQNCVLLHQCSTDASNK